jgi:hypothetical protein
VICELNNVEDYVTVAIIEEYSLLLPSGGSGLSGGSVTELYCKMDHILTSNLQSGGQLI